MKCGEFSPILYQPQVPMDMFYFKNVKERFYIKLLDLLLRDGENVHPLSPLKFKCSLPYNPYDELIFLPCSKIRCEKIKHNKNHTRSTDTRTSLLDVVAIFSW